MITIATRCEDRRAMVRMLSERLRIPAVYLHTPTYAYQLGEITVNRDASVSGEREQLLPAAECLIENGYISEMPTELTAASDAPDPDADLEAAGDRATSDQATGELSTELTAEADAPDPDADLGADGDRTTTRLRIYEPDWTVQSMTNLVRMLYTRQTLINRMLKMDHLRIDEAFIGLISETAVRNVDDFETLLHDAVQDGMVDGMNIEGGAVLVDMPNEQDSMKWAYYSQLISACIKTAKGMTRVLARWHDSEADKYHANAWLNQLGFGGPAYKELRHAFMGHLKGYAAFKSDDRMLAHKERLAEQRRIRHEINEEANNRNE